MNKKILIVIGIVAVILIALFLVILNKSNSQPQLEQKMLHLKGLINERQDNYIDVSELITPLSYFDLALEQEDFTKANQIMDELITSAENIGPEKSLRGILPETKSDCTDPRYVNTKAFEAEPFLTPDGNVLYFQYHPYVGNKCAGVSRQGLTCEDFETKKIGIRTFRTELKDGQWATPELQEIKDCTDKKMTCVIISVSPDDETAYVLTYEAELGKDITCRSNGCNLIQGQGDMWISKRISDNLWDTPQPFNPDINTELTQEDFRPNPLDLSGGPYEDSGDIFYLKFNEGITDIDDYLGTLINTPKGEILPAFDAQGNFYFTRAAGNKFLATILMYWKGAPDNEPQCIKSNGRCLSNIGSPSVGANKLVFRLPAGIKGGDINAIDTDVYYVEKIIGEPNDFGTVKPWDDCS